MKLRADLAAMIIAGVTVVAITILALYSRTIPEVLPTIALVVVGGGVGIAAPALAAAGQPTAPSSGLSEELGAKLEELLSHAEVSTGAAQAAARAAVRAAQSVTDAPPAVPSPAVAAAASSYNSGSSGYAPAGTAS